MKRFYSSFLALLLLVSFFSLSSQLVSVVEAQSREEINKLRKIPLSEKKSAARERIFISTKTSKSFPIYIYPFASNAPRKISGEIQVKTHFPNVEKIVFYLETKHQEQLWKKELLWQDRFHQNDGTRIPFSFDLPDRNIESDLQLRAEIQSPYQKIQAEGLVGINLPKVQGDALSFSELSQLSLIKGEKETVGSFLFTNYSLETPLKVKINVKPETLSQTDAQEFFVESEAVAVGQDRTIDFSFPNPSQPQVYSVSVQVFTDTDIPLSGSLEKKILIEGLFAEITDFDYEPKKAWLKGEIFTINFSGDVSTSLLESVDVTTTIFSYPEFKKDSDTLSELISKQTQILPLNRYRQIQGSTKVPIKWDTGQVRGVIEVASQGKIIGSFPFTTPTYPLPPRSVIDQVLSTLTSPLPNSERLSVVQKVAIVCFGILLLCVLVLIIWFAIKKSQQKSLSLFLILSFLSSTAFAESRHFYHFEASKEIYTSTLPVNVSIGDDFFRLIPFRGIIDPIVGGQFDEGEVIDSEVYILPVESFNLDGSLKNLPGGLMNATNQDLKNIGALLLETPFIAPNNSDYFFDLPLINDNGTAADLMDDFPNIINMDDNGTLSTSDDTLKTPNKATYRVVRMEMLTEQRSDPTDPTSPLKAFVVDFQTNNWFEFIVDNEIPVPDFSIRKNKDGVALSDPDNFFALTDSEKGESTNTYFTNDGVDITLNCGDDCIGDGDTITVKGNFCDDDATCDTTGVNDFVVCDNVLNCSGNPVPLELKHYDPEPPTFTQISLKSETNGTRSGNSTTALKTDDIYVLSILNAVETTSTDTPVDTDACGSGADNFFKNGIICQQDEFSCALSSTQRGTATFNNGNLVCGASCDNGSNNPNDPHRMVSYYCGASDPNAPSGPKNCCLPACKFEFPYCFPLPFY